MISDSFIIEKASYIEAACLKAGNERRGAYYWEWT